VTVYEPHPEDPVVPPESPTPMETSEPLPPGYTPEFPHQDETTGETTEGGQGQVKYVIDDVAVRIAVERSQYLDADGKLITEDYRVLLKDNIRATLRAQFGSLSGFLQRWQTAERKQAIIDELTEQGLPLEVLQQAVNNGQELDLFDLVSHVAFDQKPLTRRERAKQVKKRDIFSKYGGQARAVLDALLEKFADHGVQDMEDAKVLELPPFDRFGSKTQIRRGIFGGVEHYTQAVNELERALYDTHRQNAA